MRKPSGNRAERDSLPQGSAGGRWQFRQRIGAEAGFRQLFERFNEHLRSQGLFTKEGRIIDATFVEVPKQRNTREENAQIKAGEVPPHGRSSRTNWRRMTPTRGGRRKTT